MEWRSIEEARARLAEPVRAAAVIVWPHQCDGGDGAHVLSLEIVGHNQLKADFARDFGKKVFLHGRLRKRKIWGAADS